MTEFLSLIHHYKICIWEKIEYLLNTPEKREQIHKAARKEAKEKIMSLETRFGKEVNLIENTVKD